MCNFFLSFFFFFLGGGSTIAASCGPKCFRSDLDHNYKTATPTREHFCPEAIVLCTLSHVLGHCSAAATSHFFTKPVQMVKENIAEGQQTVPLSDLYQNAVALSPVKTPHPTYETWGNALDA